MKSLMKMAACLVTLFMLVFASGPLITFGVTAFDGSPPFMVFETIEQTEAQATTEHKSQVTTTLIRDTTHTRRAVEAVLVLRE